MPNVPDEVALLLALSKTDPNESDVERALAVVGRKPDWDRVLTQASRHRVLPLVARNMHRLHIYQMDEYLYANFDTAIGPYHYHLARNQALHREFAQVMSSLRERVPRLVVRKGMYLAHNVYGDPGVRPMMDLDLLVEPANAASAVEALESLGYASGKATPDLRRIEPLPREQQFYWRMYVVNLPTMLRLTSDPLVGVLVADFTVGIFPSNELCVTSTPELIDRAHEVDVRGARTLVLSPEDFVLDLCAHLYKESTMLRCMHRLKHQRLIQYCDLRETLRHHGASFDWKVLLELCDRYGAHGAVHFAMAHLELLFPGTVPVDVLEATRQEDDRFLDRFGASELPEAQLWRSPFLTRMFAADTVLDAPPAPARV